MKLLPISHLYSCILWGRISSRITAKIVIQENNHGANTARDHRSATAGDNQVPNKITKAYTKHPPNKSIRGGRLYGRLFVRAFLLPSGMERGLRWGNYRVLFHQISFVCFIPSRIIHNLQSCSGLAGLVSHRVYA